MLVAPFCLAAGSARNNAWLPGGNAAGLPLVKAAEGKDCVRIRGGDGNSKGPAQTEEGEAFPPSRPLDPQGSHADGADGLAEDGGLSEAQLMWPALARLAEYSSAVYEPLPRILEYFRGQESLEVGRTPCVAVRELTEVDIRYCVHRPTHHSVTPRSDGEGMDLFELECSGERQLIAVRGTANMGNVMSDARYTKKWDAQLGCYVHNGFLEVTNALFRDVLGLLDPEARHPVILTGHSLGGAAALLLGAKLAAIGYPVGGVVTFGQPMVSNAAGCRQLRALLSRVGATYLRVANEGDPVTRMPPFSVLDTLHGFYVHFGHVLLLHDDARPDIDQPAEPEVTEAVTSCFSSAAAESDGAYSIVLARGDLPGLGIDPSGRSGFGTAGGALQRLVVVAVDSFWLQAHRFGGTVKKHSIWTYEAECRLREIRGAKEVSLEKHYVATMRKATRAAGRIARGAALRVKRLAMAPWARSPRLLEPGDDFEEPAGRKGAANATDSAETDIDRRENLAPMGDVAAPGPGAAARAVAVVSSFAATGGVALAFLVMRRSLPSAAAAAATAAAAAAEQLAGDASVSRSSERRQSSRRSRVAAEDAYGDTRRQQGDDVDSATAGGRRTIGAAIEGTRQTLSKLRTPDLPAYVMRSVVDEALTYRGAMAILFVGLTGGVVSDSRFIPTEAARMAAGKAIALGEDVTPDALAAMAASAVADADGSDDSGRTAITEGHAADLETLAGLLTSARAVCLNRLARSSTMRVSRRAKSEEAAAQVSTVVEGHALILSHGELDDAVLLLKRSWVNDRGKGSKWLGSREAELSNKVAPLSDFSAGNGRILSRRGEALAVQTLASKQVTYSVPRNATGAAKGVTICCVPVKVARGTTEDGILEEVVGLLVVEGSSEPEQTGFRKQTLSALEKLARAGLEALTKA